jgi:Rrf2 family protein
VRWSSQVRAGLRACLELGLRDGDGPVSVREMSQSVGVSEHYLEQVMALLRRGGVVSAHRGASGGYELTRPAAEITLADLLTALEGMPEDGLVGAEGDAMDHILQETLTALTRILAEAARNVRLSDLVQEVRESGAFMYYI